MLGLEIQVEFTPGGCGVVPGLLSGSAQTSQTRYLEHKKVITRMRSLAGV